MQTSYSKNIYNQEYGRALEPRANGAWLSKLTMKVGSFYLFDKVSTSWTQCAVNCPFQDRY